MSYLILIDGQTKEKVGYRVKTKQGVFDISADFILKQNGGQSLVDLLDRKFHHSNSTLSLVVQQDLYGTQIEHLTKKYVECIDDNLEMLESVFPTLSYDIFTLDDVSWDSNKISLTTRKVAFSNSCISVDETIHIIESVNSVSGRDIWINHLELRGKHVVLKAEEPSELGFGEKAQKVEYELAINLHDKSFIRYNILYSEEGSRVALAVLDNLVCIIDTYSFNILRRIIKVRNVMDCLDFVADTELGRLFALKNEVYYNNGGVLKDSVLVTVIFQKEKEVGVLINSAVMSLQDFNIFSQKCSYGAFALECIESVTVSKYYSKSDIIKLFARK